MTTYETGVAAPSILSFLVKVLSCGNIPNISTIFSLLFLCKKKAVLVFGIPHLRLGSLYLIAGTAGILIASAFGGTGNTKLSNI